MIFEERILKISTLLENLSFEILMNFINKKHTLPNQNILQTFALELQNQTHTIELCNTTFVLNICKSVLELYSSQHFILELYSSSHFILELYSSTPVLDQFQSSAIWTKLNTTWQFAHNQGRESFSFLTLKYTSLLIHFFCCCSEFSFYTFSFAWTISCGQEKCKLIYFFLQNEQTVF